MSLTIVTMVLLLSGAYAVGGLYCNTITWIVFGLLLVWVVHSRGKEKWSEAKTVTVGFLLVLPLFLVAVIPWDAWSEGFLEEQKYPMFTDWIDYQISSGEGGSWDVVVSGYVANDGTGGGEAIVEIDAYAGYPDFSTNDTWDLTNSYFHGNVLTGWIEPGGTAPIYWTCTLSYFNAYGYVTWQISDASGQ